MTPRCCTIVVGVLLLSACTPQTRVVKYDPFLGGLPGAESGTQIIRDLGDYQDPTVIPPDKLVEETEPGKKVLTARTGRHLMIHIHNTLKSDDRDLFTSQVLSSITRAECVERGINPSDAFDFLKSREDDVAALFNMMPDGEQTPGVMAVPQGKNARRVQVTGAGIGDLYWTGFDMVMEKGNWKLRWFVR